MISNVWGTDKDGVDLDCGDPVTFVSARKRTAMKGHITGPAIGQMLQITITGDPFSVNVPDAQVTYDPKGNKIKVPTKSTTVAAPNRKELRRKAQELGIEGWEAMKTSELESAIADASTASSNGHKPAKVKKGGKKAKAKKDAKKAKAKAQRPAPEPDEDEPEPEEPKAKRMTKKAAATKQAAPVSREVAENGNPFRLGSNLFIITEELLKGGRRRAIIDRLIRKIELHPWAKKPKDIDPVYEMDKRMLLTKNLLSREYGFTFEMTGRGPENGTIKAFAPGAAKATAKATAKPAKAKKKAKR